MDKIDQFVERLDSRLRRTDDVGSRNPDRVSHKLSVVISKCGWQKRSPERMRLLGERLLVRGIWSDPPVSDLEWALETRVSFKRTPPPVPVHEMPTEKALQDYIKKNSTLIPQLREYGRKVTSEYQLPSGCQVDLLFEDSANRRWLVVELENGMKREAPAQLREYMTEVKAKKLPKGYTVEGMIISPVADPSHVALLTAPGAPGEMRWLVFQMELALRPAVGSVSRDAI